jgi:hypothetical protein
MSWTGFQRVLGVFWSPTRDGQPFHVSPGDHGGPTAWGVTEGTFRDWWLRQGKATPPSWPEALRTASRDTLAQILYQDFWVPTWCDQIPVGLDLLVFEAAAMCGPGRAKQMIRLSQAEPEALDLSDTKLVAKVQGYSPAKPSGWPSSQTFGQVWISYLSGLDQAKSFRGWVLRAQADLMIAKRWENGDFR